MKKLLVLSIIFGIITGCTSYNNGELIGVQGRKRYFETDPYGMVFVPQGSFTMGTNEQDVVWAMTATPKTVSVEPFWIDDSEITNNEYRQFVYYVIDSLKRRILIQNDVEGFGITEDENTTVSPWRMRTERCSLLAMRMSAALRSPWAPVQRTIIFSAGCLSIWSTGIKVFGLNFM